MMNDVIGITDGTRPVFEMVNKVKTAVSAVRQDHREVLPKFLAKQFSRKLSKNEWSQLYKMAKTDVAALFGTMNADKVRKMISDPKARVAEIALLEEKVQGMSSEHASLYMRKSDELAEFMVTERPRNNALLRNAEAIGRLLGETKTPVAKPSETLVRAIDALTSLYAIEKLDAGTLKTLALLAQNEAKGMDFLTNYLMDLQQRERAKSTYSEEAMLNGYKGYVPAETRNGIRLVVRSDSESKALAITGYTRVGDYQGSGAETGKMGYYFTAVGGRGTYHQGVMQTVASSAFGVDPQTGYSLTGATAGRIQDELVGATTARLRTQGHRTTGEPLMPVYDSQGGVVA